MIHKQFQPMSIKKSLTCFLHILPLNNLTNIFSKCLKGTPSHWNKSILSVINSLKILITNLKTNRPSVNSKKKLLINSVKSSAQMEDKIQIKAETTGMEDKVVQVAKDGLEIIMDRDQIKDGMGEIMGLIIKDIMEDRWASKGINGKEA